MMAKNALWVVSNAVLISVVNPSLKKASLPMPSRFAVVDLVIESEIVMFPAVETGVAA